MGDSPKQGVILNKNYTKEENGGHGPPLGFVGGLTLTTEFQMMAQMRTCLTKHVQFHLCNHCYGLTPAGS